MEQKGPLVERRVTREAKVTRKYPPGSSIMKMVRVGLRANKEGSRAVDRDPRVVKNGPLMKQRKVRSWSERSASGENELSAREVRVTRKGPLGVMMNEESQ